MSALTPMKRVLLALGLASLAITLALVASSRLPNQALPVVIGVIAGIAASLPTSLIIVWRVTKAQTRPAGAPAMPQERPPTVIVVPPAPSAPEQPATAPAPTSAQAAPPPPAGLVHETRPYRLIGRQDEA